MTSEITGMIPLHQLNQRDWLVANDRKFKNAQLTCDIAQHLVTEGKRLREASLFDAQKERQCVERKGEERVKEEDHWRSEIDNRVGQLQEGTDRLCDNKRRLDRQIEMVLRALEAYQTCVIARTKRMNIDSCRDPPQGYFIKGISLCQELLGVLEKEREDTLEQIRVNKSIIIKFREVLTEKNIGRDIDQTIVGFSPPEEASMVPTPCPVSHAVTYESWRNAAHNHCIQGEKAVNNTKDRYHYLEKLMEEVHADFQRHYDILTEALKDKVKDTHHVLLRLSDHLDQTKTKIEDQEENVQKLEDHYKERMCRLTMAKSRLHTRLCRPRVELCRDAVELELEKEVCELSQELTDLERLIFKSKHNLRALYHNKATLEVDVDTKNNSVRIDETECLGLLASINFVQA